MKNKNKKFAQKVIAPQPVLPAKVHNPFWYYALTFFICFCVHVNTVGFDFTNLDDTKMIVDKTAFLSDIRNIPQAFLHDAMMEPLPTEFYRPLQTISYILDFQFSGAKAWGYHLTNVLLYSLFACALLGLLIVCLPNVPRLGLMFISVIFSLDPFFVQAVAWIPSRGDLFLALFSTLSMVFWISYIKKKSKSFFILHIISFLFALASKETAIVLPCLLLSACLAFASLDKKLIKNLILPVFLWAGLSVTYLLLRSSVIQLHDSTLQGMLISAFKNVQVLPETLARFLFPFWFSIFASFQIGITMLGLAAFLCIGIVVYKKPKLLKIQLWGLAWFILMSLPGMTYGSAESGFDYLCHRALSALIGIIVLLACSIPVAWYRKSAFWFVGVCIGLLFSSLTIYNSQFFSNPWEFYSQGVKTNPKASSSYMGRGFVRETKGDRLGALEDYDNAIKLNHSERFARINRANLLAKLGYLEQALEEFKIITDNEPKWGKPYVDRGKWYISMGLLDSAKNDFLKALAIDSTTKGALNNMGAVSYLQGDTALAQFYYQKALSINPFDTEVLYNDALIRLRKNDLEGACREWETAATLGFVRAQQAYENHCR